jgi:hypothetical protein
MVAVDFCCFGSCLFVIFFGTKPGHHAVLLIIDISKHGAKEMGHLKMTGPGFVNVTA